MRIEGSGLVEKIHVGLTMTSYPRPEWFDDTECVHYITQTHITTYTCMYQSVVSGGIANSILYMLLVLCTRWLYIYRGIL